MLMLMLSVGACAAFCPVTPVSLIPHLITLKLLQYSILMSVLVASYSSSYVKNLAL